jgi:putative Holliday junction resolvase
MKGPVVAFDFGERRIGVAASDPSGTIAFGRDTISRSGESVPWRAILELVREAEAQRLVVGDPIHMDGSAGESSRLAREFAQELGRRTGLQVELQDERLTSVEAGRTLREGRKRGGPPIDRASGIQDQVAAVLILQTWLDRARHGEE